MDGCCEDEYLKMSIIDKLLKLAGKENFHLAPEIGTSYILRQCWKYGWMIVRGKLFSFGYKDIANNVLVGKKVKVIEKKRVSIGVKTKLQDGVYIDALSVASGGGAAWRLCRDRPQYQN